MNLRKNKKTEIKTETKSTSVSDSKDVKKEEKIKTVDYWKLNKFTLLWVWVFSILSLTFLGLTGLEYSKKNDKNSDLNVLANYYYSQKQQPVVINKADVEKIGLKYNWNSNIVSDGSQVNDMYSLVQKMLSTKQENSEKLSALQKPYTLFLSNIYFPQLNVWKDPYSNDINLFLWYEFLQKNSLMDTNLFAYWSNYFRNVWEKFEWNNLQDINIAPITQTASGFNYQVNVKITGSRRSFLALMDKLSLTSNPNSIALINEFVFRLWEETKKNDLLKTYWDKDLVIWETFYKAIKVSEDMATIRDSAGEKYIDINVWGKKYWFNINTSFLDWLSNKIWQTFEYKKFSNDWLIGNEGVFSQVQDTSKILANWAYEVVWAKYNKEISQQLSENIQQINFQYNWNNFSLVRKWNEIILSPTYKEKFFMLINDKIIFDTIKNVSSCKEEGSGANCLYTFREKYRSIPSLAYTLGQSNWFFDKTYRTQSLYNFLYNLSPILNVESFEFKKATDSQNSTAQNQTYNTNISLTTYWTAFSNEDLNQLSNYLWTKCFQNSQSALVPSVAVEKISASLTVGATNNVNMETMKNYMDLKNIIEKSSQDYAKLPNYNKSIKLVEIYRMMKDAWLCTK